MAASTNGGVTMLLPEVHITSVQTIMPVKITDPRPARQLSAADPVRLGIFRQCLHILVYYTKATQDDSRWLHAGWIKESLSRALPEQPLLAGRFRVSDGGELEIVANDSGVRLIETSIPITMAEFLSYEDSREGAEDKLVFWKDIDEHSPQYSPLFYVQVTDFDCGGRSLGISCSVLLADLLFKENFLKKWANIHHTLLSDRSLVSPFSTFQHVGKNGKTSPMNFFVSMPNKKCGKTMIFSVLAEKSDQENDDALQLCVEEAESKFGFGKSFVKIISSSCSSIKVENFQRVAAKPKLRRVSEAGWDVFGVKEVEFRQGNKPASVSYWFGFISDADGLVMALSSSVDQEGAANSVIVTVPN